jgi:RNA polymerase sigma-70 factor (ECF subfamily)
MCNEAPFHYTSLSNAARAILFRVNDVPDVRALDDASLARRIAAAPDGGDAEAEGELCRRMAPRLRLYGLRHLRDGHAAADLAQQVLMMTLERLRGGKLRQPEMLASFMLGTCRMTVLEMRRTHARRERLLDQFAADVPLADSPSEPRLDHVRLLRCLDGLPERERSVLVLTFYDDRPALAVAREMGLSEGNVRVIRHRGLQRLRDCVTGAGAAA